MNGSALLDTNVFVRLLAGDPVVDQCLREFELAYLCMIVLGELWHGAENSTRPDEGRRAVEELARRFEWLPGTPAVATELWAHQKRSAPSRSADSGKRRLDRGVRSSTFVASLNQ